MGKVFFVMYFKVNRSVFYEEGVYLSILKRRCFCNFEVVVCECFGILKEKKCIFSLVVNVSLEII